MTEFKNDLTGKCPGVPELQEPLTGRLAVSTEATFIDMLGEFERVQTLVNQFDQGTKEPTQREALELLKEIQKHFECAPKHIEAAFPRRVTQSSDGLKVPETVGTLYFVEESRRVYCFFCDDYRNPAQYVIVIRDHSKDGSDQFSVLTSGDQARKSLIGSGPQAEALYELLGNMHQGSARVFPGVPADF